MEKILSSKTKTETSLQPAIVNIQPDLENTQNNSHEGVLYDTSLENTLRFLKNNNFFKTFEDQEYSWLWKEKPIKMLIGTGFQIEGEGFDFNDNIQKALTDTSRKSVKELNDKVNFLDVLLSLGYYNQPPKRGRPSG